MKDDENDWTKQTFYSQTEIFAYFADKGAAITTRIFSSTLHLTTNIIGDYLPFYSFRFFPYQSPFVRPPPLFSRFESQLMLASVLHLNLLNTAGKLRHWQGVFTKYSTALTNSRFSISPIEEQGLDNFPLLFRYICLVFFSMNTYF